MFKKNGIFTLAVLVVFLVFLQLVSIAGLSSLDYSRKSSPETKKECDSLSSKYSLKNMHEIDSITCNKFKRYCGVKTCDSMLDLVYLWVNGSDPVLIKSIKLALNSNSSNTEDATTANRFRELGQFKFSIRSVQKNLPMARRIFIVTNNQVPTWLDRSHPQIRIVDHSELGLTNTFNSMAIQSVIHRIPTLSSPFLYVEDDIYFSSPVSLSDLWRNEKAVWYLAQETGMDYKSGNDYAKSILRSKYLVDKYKSTQYFIRPNGNLIYNGHIAMMVLIEEMNGIWERYPEVMKNISQHSVRDKSDPHIWSLYTFSVDQSNVVFDYAKNHGFFYLMDKNYKETLENMLKHRLAKFICINDDFTDHVKETVIEEIVGVYENLFPEKSDFEL